MKDFFLLAFILFFIVLLDTSCTMLEPERDSDPQNVIYKRDMEVNINGMSYVGTGIIPRAEKYHVSIKTAGKINFLLYSTCHRTGGGENQWVKWYKKKEGEFEIIPTSIENKYCPFEIEVYEKLPGRDSFFFAIFDDGLQLDAMIECDGQSYASRGNTICHPQKGKIQMIKFKKPVLTVDDPGCKAAKSIENKYFEFMAPRGRCRIKFIEPESEQFHRYILFGYDELAIRK